MARYIDAIKLEQDFRYNYCKKCSNNYGNKCRTCWVDDAVDKVIYTETADVVEVKHGEWFPYPNDAYMKCSVCGMEYRKSRMPEVVGFCPNPNCGAKMDERSDTDDR